jgi:hypothetical protein
LTNVPTTLFRPGVTSRSTRYDATRTCCLGDSPANAADDAKPYPSNTNKTVKRKIIVSIKIGNGQGYLE